MNDSNIKIIIDPGHGGLDGGATGNNLIEKDLNLKSSLYMYDRFNELGIPVKITRDSDEYLPKTERVERVKSLYNNEPNVILISNHINAGGGEGAEVVYSLKNDSTLAQSVLNNIGEAGQIKRKIYQRRLPENPNKDYYYILRETGNLEPILIEYGFIDNINDASKLKNNLEDYAEAVVKAVTEYAGYNYVKPGEIIDINKEIYIVKRGDTLYSIARDNNISVAELKNINNITNNTIYVGQELYLKNKIVEEEPSENDDIYVVKKGDTLYSISKKLNISIDTLKALNKLNTNEIYVGQQLILSNDKNTEEYDIYTVKKGDSLWSISKKYDISVKELIELNNLNNLTLQINQKLKVPKTIIIEPEENDTEIYIVEKNDTLWSISRKFNISVNELKELNNLTNNLLSIGQELKIKRTL